MTDERDRPGAKTGPPRDADPDPDATRSLSAGATPERRIGPYTLLHKLGEGGMGEVWLAEQKTPVRRRVALKLIKRGMDSTRIVARFEAERQALALMNHPNVARVIDAGTTDAGGPYFVMEYVEGVAITEHCDRHRLTTRQRLELFIEVCEGVQHAHRRGIIHRDIKPSNVLVVVDGDKRVPKIIDFGVAKATAQRLTERTVFTELGQLIGTPEYMSPEQAEMTAEDVDTRTDVYSLGVLLYELLVGALPFGSRELRGLSFDELRRKIREDEPPRPSTKVGTLGDSAETSARARSTDVRSLRRRLRGDLDWITMRALAKDRTRRYGSAVEFAADVRRHLENEPVAAGPPSMTYKTGRFIRRHRFGVAVAALVSVVLAGAAWREIVQARRVERERDEAVWRGYVASVQAAADALAEGRIEVARDHLAQCPPELRGWEWEMVRGTLPPDPRRLDVGPVATIGALRLTGDGSRLQAFYQRHRSTSFGELSLSGLEAGAGWTERKVLDFPYDPNEPVFINSHAMDASGSIGARCDGNLGQLQVASLGDEADGRPRWSRPLDCADLAFVGRTPLLAVRPRKASKTQIFDVASGAFVWELPRGDIAGASELPILGVFDGEAVVLHDLESGKVVRRVSLPLDRPEAFLLSARAERAWLGYEGGLLVDIEFSTEKITRLSTRTAGTITALAATPDGRVVAFGTSDGAVGLVPVHGPARLLTRHGSRVVALAIDPEASRVFSADGEGSVVDVEFASNQVSGLRTGMRGIRWRGRPRTVRFDPDGDLAAVVTWGRGAMLVDGTSLRIIETLFPRASSGIMFSTRLFWSTDGRRLVADPVWKTDEPSGLQVWSLDERGRSQRVFVRPDEGRPFGLLGVASDGRSWLRRNVEDGIVLEKLDAQGLHTMWEVPSDALAGRPTAALPDEPHQRWIVGLEGAGLIALQSEDGRISARAPLAASATPLAMHPAGELLLAKIGDGGLAFVDVATLRSTKTVPRDDRRLEEVRFTPDGSRFVVGFLDGTIEVWSTDKRQPVTILRWTTDQSLFSLDVAADGRLLVALEDELMALGPWSVEP